MICFILIIIIDFAFEITNLMEEISLDENTWSSNQCKHIVELNG